MTNKPLFITLSVLFIASAYALTSKPWKEAKEKPSDKSLAIEILKLETSGYRVPDSDHRNCLKQEDFKFIKAKAPLSVTEDVGIEPITLAALPEIVSIENSEEDPSIRIVTFKMSDGKTDKLSFSVNSPRKFEESGFATLLDTPEKAYVRKECL